MDKNVTVTVDMSAFIDEYAIKMTPTLTAIERLVDAMYTLPPDLRRIVARELSEQMAAMAEES